MSRSCRSFVDTFRRRKYFKHIENEIREDFTFKDEILNPCKEMIESVQIILLHFTFVALIMLLTVPTILHATLEYYEEALIAL